MEKKQVSDLSNVAKALLKLKIGSVIDKYLREEITRDEAIRLIGAKMIEIAEKQLKVVFQVGYK